MEKNIENVKYISEFFFFTNFDHLTNGILIFDNPNIYYSARSEQFNRRVCDEFNNYIISLTQHDLPIAPNFFLAVKGTDEFLVMAGRQTNYDNALDARNIHNLQLYKQEKSIFDNNVYIISLSYHDNQLKIFTNHFSQLISSENRSEYPSN
jgi:hypothetical protein